MFKISKRSTKARAENFLDIPVPLQLVLQTPFLLYNWNKVRTATSVGKTRS